eukprot:673993-Prymnesium_polylepis.1
MYGIALEPWSAVSGVSPELPPVAIRDGRVCRSHVGVLVCRWTLYSLDLAVPTSGDGRLSSVTVRVAIVELRSRN